MPPKTDITVGVIDAKTGGFIELAEIPIFSPGGMIHSDDMIPYVGESSYITARLKKKTVKKMRRHIMRAIYGSNNRRKFHGLPMYRQ